MTVSEIPRRDTVLRFEPFELDLARAELRKNGRKVNLAPQPYQVLALLASQGDRVVSREELRDELWGGETFVDFEQGINTCIKQIRQALGDDPLNPCYIATVPKRGYRFVAGAESAAVPSLEAWRRRYPAALLLSSLLVAFAAWTLFRPSRNDGLVLRTTITTDARVGDMAFSPDGRSLVYLSAEHPTEGGGRRLMLRRLDEADARALPGTIGSFNPFFFPDGESIGFALGKKLASVRVDGGEARTLAEHGEPIRGLTASEDEIVFGSYLGGLYRVRLGGGKPEPLTRLAPDERSHRWPHFLPDGKTVLFTILLQKGSPQDAVVAACSLSDGRITRLVEKGFQPAYASTGHLLFGRGEALMAVPFDRATLHVRGEPIVVVPRVSVFRPTSMNLQWRAVSPDGTLAYVPAAIRKDRVVWLDRKGEVAETLLEDRDVNHLELSPDGNRVAFTLDGTRIGVLDRARGVVTTLPLDHENDGPIWLPDGKTLAFFTRGLEGAYGATRWIGLEDGSPPRVVHVSPDVVYPVDASPDGRSLVLFGAGGGGIFILDLATESVVGFVEDHVGEPVLAPNGRALAHPTPDGIVVRSFPEDSWNTTVSTEPELGVRPFWSRDGTKMLYKFRGGLYEVEVSWTPEPSFGKPTLVFQRDLWEVYDIDDAGRFLAVLLDEVSVAQQIRLVTNWFQELEELVPME